MRHPNQVLTRDHLIALAFNNHFDGFDRAIDTHIRRLRKQIHVDGRQPIKSYRVRCLLHMFDDKCNRSVIQQTNT